MGGISRSLHDELKDLERKRCQRQFTKWKAKSVQLRHNLGMGPSSALWTGRPGIRLSGMGSGASQRQRDLIDICFEQLRSNTFKQHGRVPVAQLVKNAWCNVSQSVDCGSIYAQNVPTLTKTAELYSFRHDAILSGDTHVRMMGWPYDCTPPKLSQSELRSLAGDSYSLPIMAMIVMGLYSNPHAPWWKASG